MSPVIGNVEGMACRLVNDSVDKESIGSVVKAIHWIYPLPFPGTVAYVWSFTLMSMNNIKDIYIYIYT